MMLSENTKKLILRDLAQINDLNIINDLVSDIPAKISSLTKTKVEKNFSLKQTKETKTEHTVWHCTERSKKEL